MNFKRLKKIPCSIFHLDLFGTFLLHYFVEQQLQSSFRIMSYQTKEQTCFSVSGLCYCWIFFYISLHGSIALPLTILPILCSSVSRFQALGVICALCNLSNKFLFRDMFFKSFCIKRISLTNPSMCS